MRFLMITSFYPPHHFGGDATYLRQLSRALVRRGHQVRVIYCYDAYRASGGRIPKNATTTDDGVEVRMLHAPSGTVSALISQQMGRPGPKAAALHEELAAHWDVVHFHNISLIGAPAILSQSRAPVTLLTAHDHWLVCATHIFWKNRTKACDRRECLSCQIRSLRPPQLWRMTEMLRRHMQGVDLVLAPSEYTAQKLREGGIDRPISLLGLFAGKDFETRDLDSEEPFASDRAKNFIYAGRLTASKGVDRLAHLFRSRPEYRLDIVGDGDLLPYLSKEFSADRNIHLPGRVEQTELKRLYRNASATLLPSLAPETFGLTTIEGFSQGTPAIVRDSGGAGEVVRAHGAGLVFSTDAEALEAIDCIAESPDIRAEMSARARDAYLNNFTEDIHLTTYLDLIKAQTPGSKAGTHV